MNRFLLLLLTLLYALTGLSQGTQKIKRTYQGTVQKGRAVRDLALYPRTPAGNDAFLSAINSQALSITLASGLVLPALNAPTVPVSTTSVVAVNQILSASDAVVSGTNMSAFGGGSGPSGQMTCCYDQPDRYATYTIPGIPGAGSLAVKLTYQTNNNLSATGTMVVGPTSTDFTITGTSGGKASTTVTMPFQAGTNTLVIKGKSGLFIQDRLDITGNIALVTTAPGSATSATGPSWATLRYSLLAGELYIEGAGTDLAQIKFERVDNTALTGYNVNNPSLSSGVFYGYGPNDGQGLYDKQWKITFTPAVAGQAMRLTLKRSTGELYTHVFTPQTGANRVSLFQAGATTTTPPATTTASYPSYARGVIVGNSITTHTASTALNWSLNNGMAASAPEKDYAHLIEAELRKVNPAFTLAPKGQGSGLEQGYNSADAQAVANTVGNLVYELRQDYGQGVQFDLIIVSISENIAATGFDEAKFRAMLDQLLAGIPKTANPTIVFRNSFWDGNAASNAFLQAYATGKGYRFANLDAIRERADYKASQYANAGVAHHPNDAGHAAIANLILAQLGQSATSPGTVVTVGTGQGLYAANSSYSARAEAGGRPAYGMPSWLTNGTLKIGLTPTLGDVITHLQEGDGISLVNNPIFSNGKFDLGRQIMDAIYGFPDGSYKDGQPNEGHYTEANQSTGQYKEAGKGSIGWNPVEGGDEAYKGAIQPNPNPSPVLVHSVDGTRAYTKSQPMQWDMNGVVGKVYIEKWVDFDPANARAFRLHRRWSMFRDDPYTAQFPTARQQEAPCFYITPRFREYYYCAGQPYTNAALTRQDIVANPALQQQPVFSTEPFVFARNPETGKVVCLLHHNARFTFGRFINPPSYGGGEPGYDTPTGLDAGYLNAAPMMHLDADGVYDFDAALFVGNSLDEARAWAYAQPRWNGLPEYRFDQTQKSRLGFWLHHAQDQLERNMTSGSLDVRPLQLARADMGLDMKVNLPEKWIDGHVVKHLFVKAQITSSTSQFWLNWRRAGDNTDYHKMITLPNDGIDHVTDIDLSGEATWNNQDIVQCSISHAFTGSWPSVNGDVWRFKWISYRNLN